MNADDVQKILNLKYAWEFILDNDVIQTDSNYYLRSTSTNRITGYRKDK